MHMNKKNKDITQYKLWYKIIDIVCLYTSNIPPKTCVVFVLFREIIINDLFWKPA